MVNIYFLYVTKNNKSAKFRNWIRKLFTIWWGQNLLVVGLLGVKTHHILLYHSRACGIDLGDFYVTIGGQGGSYTGLKMVTKYSKLGQSEDLPQLQTGRYHLGCSSYTDSNGNQVRIADI